MYKHLILYSALKTDTDNSVEIARLVLGELGEDKEFFHGCLELGLDPLLCTSGTGDWVARFRMHIKREEARVAKIKLQNNGVALERPQKVKGVSMRSDMEEMFVCAHHPYTLARIEKARIIGEKLAQANAAKNGGNQVYTEK